MVPVLLLTRDDPIRAAVGRLAALAGIPLHVDAPGSGARAVWREAGLVIVGPDSVAEQAMPRRDGVVVVTQRPTDAAIWQGAVAVGAEQVLVLPDSEPQLLDLLVAAAEPAGPRAAVVGVLAGSGGAGASTLAAALGLTAARSGPAVLIDGDPLGGGLDVLLGAEHTAGARWPDLAGTRGRLRGAALLEALPHVSGLAVVSWDRGDLVPLPAVAATSVLDAAARVATTVVVDLPRHLDAASDALSAGCDEVLLVVVAAVRASVAAARLTSRLTAAAAPVGLVVCDVGSPRLAPDEIAASLGLPLRGVVRHDAEVAVAARAGRPLLPRPRGPLHDRCCSLLAGLGADRAVA